MSINDINATADQKPLKTLYFVPILAVLCLVPIGFINAQTDTIPSWVKGIAGFWAEDNISEAEFIDAIEFLIDGGIIQIDRIGELEEENARLRQELQSSSSSVQSQLSTPESTLKIGDSAYLTIPDGWTEQNFRDPFTGEMVYNIAEESTLNLPIATVIGVREYPIEHQSAKEQYLTWFEDYKDYLSSFIGCLEVIQEAESGSDFYTVAYTYNLDPLCDIYKEISPNIPPIGEDEYGYQESKTIQNNMNIGVDIMKFSSNGKAYLIGYTGYGNTYDEFYDTFQDVTKSFTMITQ